MITELALNFASGLRAKLVFLSFLSEMLVQSMMMIMKRWLTPLVGAPTAPHEKKGSGWSYGVGTLHSRFVSEPRARHLQCSKIEYLVRYVRHCSPMSRVLSIDYTSCYTCLLSSPTYRRFHFYVALVGNLCQTTQGSSCIAGAVASNHEYLSVIHMGVRYKKIFSLHL